MHFSWPFFWAARPTLVGHLEHFAVVFDLERRVIELSRPAAAALGISTRAAVGRPATEVLAVWPEVAARLRGPAEGNCEVAIGALDYELTFSGALNDAGQRYATLLILRDVTARKRAEIETSRERDGAESADQAKGRFLAMMSHEIRTPMNGLIGFTDLLSETKLDPEQKEYLGYINESGRALLVIIDDVLDFSKIEAGELNLEREPVEIRALVAKICATLVPRARAKRLTLQWKIEDSVPGVVYGDPVRLRQIINNLAGNALKFTDFGTIDLTVAVADAEEELGSCSLAISVRDTGIGMNEETIGRIFRAFSQADNSTTRRYGGTGLGLAITRRLCELMGGRLDVASVVEQGSTFTAQVRVSLTAGPTPAPISLTPPAPALPPIPRSILVFEDNPINARLITTVLKQAGHRVRSATDGLAGLAVLEAGAQIDVIFMDLQMPGMDGYAAVKEIRRREAGGWPRHHIIALTAHALKGERQKCLDAGMDDYLAKPVDHGDVWAALARAPTPRDE